MAKMALQCSPVQAWKNSSPPNPSVILYPKIPTVTWGVGLKPAEAGLTNMGSTCFVNSALQALFHLPGFAEFLSEDKEHRAQCFSLLECVLCSVYRCYLNMSLHRIFKPSGLLNLLPKIKPSMKVGKQEDAHEFLMLLLGKIEDHLLSRCPRKLDLCSQQTTAIGRLFGWWIETKDTCISCLRSSKNYSPVSTFTVALESGSLQQAVNDSWTDEVIEDFDCLNKCEARQCCRSFSFYTYPRVLRMVFDRFGDFGVKNELPINIEKSVTVGKAVYHFASAIIHEGHLVSQGHYTCLALRSDGKLMYYNDSVVTEGYSHMNSDKTKRGIYVAFYQLHHLKPESIKRSPPNTPSKAASPLHKKLHVPPLKKSLEKKTKGKMLTFSPKKFKRKLANFVTSILPQKTAKPEKTFDEEAGAKPVNEVNEKTVDVETLAKPLNEVNEIPEEHQPPFVLALRKKSLVSEGTINAPITPMKITRSTQIVPSTPASTETTINAPITPIKITWQPRAEPKSRDSQSNNEYTIQRLHDPDGKESVPNHDTDLANSVIDDFVSHVKTVASADDLEVLLTADDVPGGRLRHKAIHKHKVSQLRRWLHVRGLDDKGKKVDLVDKVKNCIKNGEDSLIDPTVDGGRWYDAKLRKVKNIVHGQGADRGHTAISDEDGYVPLPLTADDVPGAHLPKKILEKNTVAQLQRWLDVRGIPHKGTKKVLIEKIKNCIALGEDSRIDPKIDGGWWYDAKRQELPSSQNFALLKNSDLFAAKSGWGEFPSRDIPIHFTFGTLIHYLVETMPIMEDTAHLNEDSSGDEEEEEIVTIADPFLDAECKEIKFCKKLRRGLQYVKSGYVRNVQDSLPDRAHLYRASVRASMSDRAYSVKVALSQVSGSVVKCCCDVACPQKSLGRCSHISALLLFILLHKNLEGPEAVTCTSKPNSWNRGSKKNNPTAAKKRQYDSFKINVVRRANFDPRATRYQTGYPQRRQINDFLCELSTKEIPSLFQSILSIQYEEFDFDEGDMDIFYENRAQLYEALRQQLNSLKPYPAYQGPFEAVETRSQSSTIAWRTMRALHCSAQPSHQIANFKAESAKMNFLRTHLWGIGLVSTKGMAYGKRQEPIARKDYADAQLQMDATSSVVECGLYLNTEFVGLSCSPDGIKKSAIENDTLLEIKCLYNMRNENPEKFDEVLPSKKLSSFCLKRDYKGDIILKKNHAYYDQIQLSMGLMGLVKCDFVVWTKVKFITIRVPFDEERWMMLKKKLTNFHKEYLVPEYFAMKTPRQLKPAHLPLH